MKRLVLILSALAAIVGVSACGGTSTPTSGTAGSAAPAPAATSSSPTPDASVGALNITIAEQAVGNCILSFYGNAGYNNVVPSYLGNGQVKFTATGDPHADGSVTVQVDPNGHVEENSLLDAMGCSTLGSS